jgi:very-short-patch-repair endonuclease
MPALDPAIKRERLKGFSRDLRASATEVEKHLWSLLRDRRLAGYKFRRQQPIGPFIVDFVCYEAKLIVELDGSQHADDPTDTARDTDLCQRGFRVLRIWNNELSNNRNGVLEAILAAASEARVAPPSSGASRHLPPSRGKEDPTAPSAQGGTQS